MNKIIVTMEQSIYLIKEQILETMTDLNNNSKDTIWVTDLETMFERLAFIYGLAGGDYEILHQKFPQYFQPLEEIE